MKLSSVLYSETGNCKICGKQMNDNKLEEHYLCLDKYKRNLK